jgi:hypothetical protein
MDIEKLLTRAADYCDMAINSPPRYLLAERIAFAQIADACANLARVMIEYERWQDERLEVERRQMLAARNSEPPF